MRLRPRADRLVLWLSLGWLSFSAPAVAAPALFGNVELAAGGGHDTNMFLQVSPDAATRTPPVAGWFGQGAPQLDAALVFGGWRLEGAYALDYRGSDAAGHLALQEMTLSLASAPLGPVQPNISVFAGRFDASRFSESRFLFGGGAIGLRLELTPSFRLAASYRLELRRYPGRTDGSDRDTVHLIEVRASYRPVAGLEMGAGSSYVGFIPARVSAMADGDVRLLRFGPDLLLSWGRASLGVGAWAGTLAIAGLEREWQLGGNANVLFRVASHLDIVCAFELTRAPWASDTVATDFSRRTITLSVVAHAGGKTTFEKRTADDELRPLVDAGAGRVRFRVRAAGASTVRVVGAWNDWAEDGPALERTRDTDLWEGWVELPPGTYRYRFLVDGQAVRPVLAPRYVADDFGGEDGVLEIPDTSRASTP